MFFFDPVELTCNERKLKKTLPRSLSRHTVKPHVKALGLYNFIRGFGWAYKLGRGGAYIRWAHIPGGGGRGFKVGFYSFF